MNEAQNILEPKRSRALSHREYLDSLPVPQLNDIRRISDIQLKKEGEVTRKYLSAAEHDAAVTIQSAYRGHRERRQMAGLTLDPSSRWTELIKELRFRSATAPHADPRAPGPERPGSSSSKIAKTNWSRVAVIAERASSPGHSRISYVAVDGDSLSSNVSAESQKSSMMMDLRYFLEMVDEKHRYGANLQIYWEEWQLSGSRQNFFYWLDRGEGRRMSHPYCDRTKLDSECIRYLTKEERQDYLVTIDSKGLLRWAKNNELITTSTQQYKDSMHGIVSITSTEPTFHDASTKQSLDESHRFNREIAALRSSLHQDHSDGSDTDSTSSTETPETLTAHHGVTKDRTPRKKHHVSPATILNHLLRKSVRPGTWIYVADTLGRLYVGIKSSGAFQHASFLAGGRISSAGSISIDDGHLTYLSPLSGHYRPTTKSFRLFIDGLKDQGVDLHKLKVSQAYGILLSMEYYGKTKEGLKKMTKGKGQNSNPDEGGAGEDEKFISATGLVDKHWRKEGHVERKGLARLMDDLHIRRKSDDQT